MKLNLKEILFCTLGLVLLIWLIVSQVKCNHLRNQLNEEKMKNLEQVDSLEYANKQHLKQIKVYEYQISELKMELDSLEKAKSKIIVKKDDVIVSNNVSEATKLLKENLETWKR